MFLFIDIETTGLDPNTDYILELGMAITDNDLNVINTFSRVIKPAVWGNWVDKLTLYLPEVVHGMHAKSGLLDEVTRFGQPTREVELEAIAWMENSLVTDLPASGSSVHFDRSFLKASMPTLEGLFHYRNIDVSTLKELAKRWNPEVLSQHRPAGKHRALPDIEDTINELAIYRRGFLV